MGSGCGVTGAFGGWAGEAGGTGSTDAASGAAGDDESAAVCGDARRVVDLIAASAAPFRTVLENIIRLERGAETWSGGDDDELAREAADVIGIPSALVAEVLAATRGSSTIADPSALVARYLDASERVWRFVDGWTS